MFRGKRWLPVAGIVMGLCVVLLLPTVARAGWVEGWFDDLDPAEGWLKYNEPVATPETGVSHWYMPEVPEGFATYEYKAEVTKLWLEVAIPGNWLDVTSYLLKPPKPGEDPEFYVEGSASGLGFPIWGGPVSASWDPDENPLTPEEFIMSLYIAHEVKREADTDPWQLNTSMTLVDFGTFMNLPVLGFKVQIPTGIKPVPEPGTLALFGTGALVGLVAWRRRRK